jgi:hypothetical protein
MLSESYKKEELKTEIKDEGNEMITEHESIEINNNNINTVNNLSGVNICVYVCVYIYTYVSAYVHIYEDIYAYI